MATEITVGMAGAAGDGLDRTGDTLARTAARLGLHLFTYNSYQSLIRGGHTWLRLRLSEEKVDNHGDHLNVLVALNQDGIERHAREVEAGGAIIFNGSKLHCDPSLVPEGVALVPIPVTEITAKLGKLPPVMQNTAALGALLHLMGFDVEVAAEILAETFKKKGQEVIDQNVGVLRAGHGYAAEHARPLGQPWSFSRKRRPVVTGNQMIALGAVAGGCKFYSAYPMSPASFILHWLASHSEQVGVLVKQAEDELAVVNLASGAGHAGVRAMCATSGGGFALMTEAIGMAGMIETPVVVVNVQRGGPSTGMPTRTQQADILLCAYASHGDTKHVLLFPEDPRELFEFAAQSFDLAERLQTPIFVMEDLDIGMNDWLCAPFAWDDSKAYDRGKVMTYEELEAGKTFGRYLDVDGDAIPYRTMPGTHPTKGAYFTRGTSRDRYARYTEEGAPYADNMQRLIRKFETAKDLVPRPLQANAAKPTKYGVIYYGSTSPAMDEAIHMIEARGQSLNRLRVRAFPFHSSVTSFVADHDFVFVVEQNRDGQLRSLIVNECGIDPIRLVPILHYDGTPITARFIARAIGDHLDALKVTPLRKVVS